ncbi:hypothetical protein M2352_002391 [Azospirillum fermentarium]|uniref:hypothetical protein n=1 Tax=Azospirillum fermentarium TaxID=1233114 RepID=UPI002226409C|nr:hypothetical protein [Azospirillum fermentarium]MCW2246800.1 hypothetical protein [Azospirillum fermentarium]
MTAFQRAQILRWRLQQHFRIDLYSPVAERDFERRLAEAIDAAEREGYRRGQEEARGTAAPHHPHTAPHPHAAAPHPHAHRQRSGIIARRQ